MAKKLPINNKKDVKLKTSQNETEKGAENKNLPKTNQKLNPLAKKLQKVIQKTDKPKVQPNKAKENEPEKVEEIDNNIDNNNENSGKKDKKKKKERDTVPKYDISSFGYPVFDVSPIKVDYTPKEGEEHNPDKELGWTLDNNYFYLLEEAAKKEMESEDFKKHTPKLTLKDLKRNRSIESGACLNTVLARMLKFQKKGIIGAFTQHDTLIVGRIAIAFFRKNNFDESLVEKFMENDLEVNTYKDDGVKMVDRQILFYACKFKMMITPRLRSHTARYNHQQQMMQEHPGFAKKMKAEDILPPPKPAKTKKPKPVKKVKQAPPQPNPNKIKKPKFEQKPINDPKILKENRRKYDHVKPNFDIKPKYMLDPITRQLVRIEDVMQNQNPENKTTENTNTENVTTENKNTEPKTEQITTPKIETFTPITKKDVENTQTTENTNTENTNTENTSENTEEEGGEEGKTRRRRVIIRKKP